MMMTLERMAEVLRTHVPTASDLQSLEKLSAGHVNETFVGRGADIILRLPAQGNPLVSGHDVCWNWTVGVELFGRNIFNIDFIQGLFNIEFFPLLVPFIIGVFCRRS